MHEDGELREQLFSEGLSFGGLRALVAGHIERVADDGFKDMMLAEHTGDVLEVCAAIGAVQGEERLRGDSKRVGEGDTDAAVAYVEADDAGREIVRWDASPQREVFRSLPSRTQFTCLELAGGSLVVAACYCLAKWVSRRG